MRKGLKLAILCLGLTFAGASAVCACSSVSSTQQITYAEEAFEEKAYSYETEEGVVTITLISEDEATLLFHENGGEEQIAYGHYSREGNVIKLTVLGKTMTLELDEEEMKFFEHVEEDVKAKEWLVEQYERFVVPLLSGVSLTSIVGFIATVLIAWLKNKKLDKEIVKVNKKEVSLGAIEERLVSLLEKCEGNASLDEELRTELKSTLKDIDFMKKSLEKAENIAVALKIASKIVASIARTSKEFVSSGMAEEVEELERLLENI